MNRVLLAAQRGLLLAGVILCGFCVYRMLLINAVSAQVPVVGGMQSSVPVKGSLLAHIEIPAAHISAAVLEGVDEDQLERAAGHVPHTALPGGLGNFAVAAHRDTVFRNLPLLRPGMDILITAASGHYRYRIESVGVVKPSDVSILDVSDAPVLTLISCFPFRYIGPAPLRFYVRADLLTIS